MKVGLNATCINARPSGAMQRFVGIYGNLIRRLDNIDFTIYEPIDNDIGNLFKKHPNLKVKKTSVYSEEYFKKFTSNLGYWKSTLKNDNLDIFEIFSLPIFKNPLGKTFLTIHDLRGMKLKWNFFKRVLYWEALKRSVHSCDHIITVSNCMKKELNNLFPEKKITVIYNGIDSQAYNEINEDHLNNFQHKYKIPSDFLLTVGHFEERKNYLKLIESLNILNQKNRSYPLIIIGNDSGYKKQIQKKINYLKLDKNIKILSNLNDFEVRCAYKLCKLFIFPSLYEGFGIPILEAMASKCPMILSNLEVFREITENKSIYFDQDNIDSIAYTIENVIDSQEEHNRQINYGLNRIKSFEFSEISKSLEILYRGYI